MLALPALGSSLMEPLLTLADNAFVSTLGQMQLASLSPSNGLLSFVNSVSFQILMTTTSIAVAKTTGSGRLDQCRKVLRISVVCAGLIGSTIAVFIIVFSHSIVSAFGASAAITPYSVSFLRWRSLGIPLGFLTLVASGAFRAMGDTKTPFLISLLSGAVNFCLDALFVLVLHWGVSGAALATSVAQGAGVVVAGVAVWNRRKDFGLTSPPPSPPPSIVAGAESNPVLELGSSSVAMFGRQIFNNGLWLLCTGVVTRFGDATAAAQQAMLSVWLILTFINDCIASSSQVIVARSIFRGDGAHTASARSVVMRTIVITVILALSLMILGELLRWTVLRPMLHTPEALELVDRVFPIVLGCFPIPAIVWALDGAYFGASDFVYNAINTAVSAVTCAAALLLFGKNLTSVWIIMTGIYFGFRLISHLLRLSSTRGPFLYTLRPIPE